MLLEAIPPTALSDSLFGYSAPKFAALMLASWAIVVGAFVCSNFSANLHWVPVLLGIAGVLGSIFLPVVTGYATLAINVATLILFLVSVDMLKRRQLLIVPIRHRQ
jgi:hypothetical protein